MRGAIDLTLIAGELFYLDPERVPVSHSADRSDTSRGGRRRPKRPKQSYRETVYDAMVVALSGRIFLDETVEATPEQVLRQIWEDHFILDPGRGGPRLKSEWRPTPRSRRPGPAEPDGADPAPRAPMAAAPQAEDADGGAVLRDVSRRRRAPEGGRRRAGNQAPVRVNPGRQPASGGPATTDEQADAGSLLNDAAAVADPETLRRAREIAARLAVPRPRRDRTARRGRGEVASVPYRGGSDDIDLDRTLSSSPSTRCPRTRTSSCGSGSPPPARVVLLVDVSGSMRGERVRTAAATVGALAAELTRDNLAVIAFWSDAAVLCHLGQRIAPQALVESMAADPGARADQRGFPAAGRAPRARPGPRPGRPGAAAVRLRAQRRSRPAAVRGAAAQAGRPARHDRRAGSLSWPATSPGSAGGSSGWSPQLPRCSPRPQLVLRRLKESAWPSSSSPPCSPSPSTGRR